MQMYQAHGVVRLHMGRVVLSAEQLRRRRNFVRATEEEGVYEIMHPIEFKVGETFGYDGGVSKTQALIMQSPETEEDPQDETEEDPQDETEEDPQDETEVVYPQSVGGPWFQLSNGERVKGKENAEKAEAALR